MRFSSGSTNLLPSSKSSFLPLNSSQRTLNQSNGSLESSRLEIFNYYCSEMMKVSQQLNEQLLINTQLLYLREQLTPSTQTNILKSHTQKSCSDFNSTASAKNNSDDNQRENKQKVKRNLSKRYQKTESCEEDYVPSQDSQKDETIRSKSSQSKNIPKNYSKAIFAFIRKNQFYRNKVLRHLNIDKEEFMFQLQSLKGGVSSISQLQDVWARRGRISKAFRIMSMEYLRKHCLWHIFNSRVNIYGKHIKYRYRMAESVADPDNFTRMKEF